MKILFTPLYYEQSSLFLFLLIFQLVSTQNDDKQEPSSYNNIHQDGHSTHVAASSMIDTPLLRNLRHSDVIVKLRAETDLIETPQNLQASSARDPEIETSSEQTCQYVFNVPQHHACGRSSNLEEKMREMMVMMKSMQGQMKIQRRRLDVAEAHIRKFHVQRRKQSFSHETSSSYERIRTVNPSSSKIRTNQNKKVSRSLEVLSEVLQVQLSNLEIQVDDGEKARTKLQATNSNLTTVVRLQQNHIQNLTQTKYMLQEAVATLQHDLDSSLRENQALLLDQHRLTSQNSDLQDTFTSISQRFERLTSDNDQLGNETKLLRKELAELQAKKYNQVYTNTTAIADDVTDKLNALKETLRAIKKNNRTSPCACVDNDWSKDDNDDVTYNYTQCGRLLDIAQPDTMRESRRTILKKVGVWMKDPIPGRGRDKIWSIAIIGKKIRKLVQYPNMTSFQHYRPEARFDLHVPIESNGAVVYNGSLYYQRRNSRRMVRYEIGTSKPPKERAIKHAGFHGLFAYLWGGFSDIDFAVDETGLWVIYSTQLNKGNIVVSKVDPINLRITRTIPTNIPKRRVSNSFIICQVLYTVNSYKASQAKVEYSFDLNSSKLKKINIPLRNNYQYNNMIDYNPRDRYIYAWDYGRQVRYKTSVDDSMGEVVEGHIIPRNDTIS